MKVLDLTRVHVEECYRLALANWGDVAADHVRAQMDEFLGSNSYEQHFYVAEIKGGAVVGFASYRKRRTGFWIVWIAVNPDYQGRAVGKALTEKLLTAVRARGATEVSGVTRDAKFFYRFGFDLVNEFEGGWSLVTNRFASPTHRRAL